MVIYINDSGVFKSDNNYPMNNASVNKTSPVKEVTRDTGSVVREAQQAFVAENTPAYTVSISSMGRAAVQSIKSFDAGMKSLNERFASQNVNNGLTPVGTSDVFKKTENDTSKISSANNISDTDTSVATIYSTAVDINDKTADINNENTVSAAEVEPEEREESRTSSVNTNNLTRYSELQLQQMVNDGTITRADMNDELEKRTGEGGSNGIKVDSSQEPLIRQAVAAYNFQMSFQINAVLMQ